MWSWRTFLKSFVPFIAAVCMTVIPVSGFAQDMLVLPDEPSWHWHRLTRAQVRAARAVEADVFTHVFGPLARSVARFNRLDPRFAYAGMRIRVPELADGAEYSPMPASYPPAAAHDRYILLALDRQFLGVYERGALVASYPISSGREGYKTPTGTFRVTRKDATHVSSRYPEPTGGWPMPWALRFYRSEYWMHGGELVGRPASHGCVRLFPADAEALFAYAQVGDRVRIVRTLAPPSVPPAAPPPPVPQAP